ncbi:hypothetical protein [Bradyrhizobium manausense]|uniref:hypothetical protein n=1 Tax=Bradyrhizobium manausense TaxID=989370 RepID=UPI000A8D4922|nr:hypothetical protein [Bradyrhizobium manausense]
MFESLLGLWVSRIGPDAPIKVSSAAFQLHPLIVPFEDLSRFTDGFGKRPRGVAWKAAFRSLTTTPNLAKDAFAELAAKSLTLWTPDEPSDELAFLKGRLGTAIDDSDKAITYLSEALAVLKPNEFPHWGTWKYDLGCHYAERATGERGSNVDLAVACFEDALGHISLTEDPLAWAMCSSNLSALYGERLLGDRAENCERALHHVQNTFAVFTPQSYPENCARSHIMAGQALRDRLLGDKNENIERAIEHYQRALDHFHSVGDPDESATIHALLGQAYLIKTGGTSSPYAADAVRHIEIALHAITKERDEFRWAGNVLNLALAYQCLPGDISMSLERAIYYYGER